MRLNIPDAMVDDAIDTQIDGLLAALAATKGEFKKAVKEALSDGQSPLDVAMQDALQAWFVSAQGAFESKRTAGMKAVTG